LMDSTMSLKVETTEWGVGACFLVCNILKVERCAGALRLGGLINKSITYMDLHKPNNKVFMQQRQLNNQILQKLGKRHVIFSLLCGKSKPTTIRKLELHSFVPRVCLCFIWFFKPKFLLCKLPGAYSCNNFVTSITFIPLSNPVFSCCM
jgi:hypothetical protein